MTKGKQDMFALDSDYVRYALTIGHNAPMREILNVLCRPSFSSVIPAFSDYDCIRILALKFSEVPF
ncbi:hypothetical protein GGI21_006048 [Coemansia aciculifera]|nr:hypothetical protein GGI21_006048 [Coemansia aciculifera]